MRPLAAGESAGRESGPARSGRAPAMPPICSLAERVHEGVPRRCGRTPANRLEASSCGGYPVRPCPLMGKRIDTRSGPNHSSIEAGCTARSGRAGQLMLLVVLGLQLPEQVFDLVLAFHRGKALLKFGLI